MIRVFRQAMMPCLLGLFTSLGYGQRFDEAVASEVGEREMALLRVDAYLGQGDQFLAEGDLRRAAGAYRSAFYELPFGEAAGNFREAARQKFAKTATAYAQSLAEESRLKAARAVLDEVLEADVAPDYEPAKVLASRLEDPDWYPPGNTPEHVQNVNTVEVLLREAKTLAELGKFDEATAKYSEVINIDNTNAAARKGLLETERLRSEYLRSSQDRTRIQMLDEIAEKWSYDDPDVMRRAGITTARGAIDLEVQTEAPQSAAIAEKLRSIVVPEINLNDVTLPSALSYLQARSMELDNTGLGAPGVRFVLSNDPAIERSRPITLTLRDTPLAEVLRYIVEQANARYLIEEYAVRIVSLTSEDDTMISREFTVRPDFFTAGPAAAGTAVSDDPFAPTGTDTARFQRLAPEEFLETQAGVAFPEGASAQYIASANKLIVRNTRSNLDLVSDLVAGAYAEGPKQVTLTVRVMDISQENLEELSFDWLLAGLGLDGDQVFVGGGTPGNSERSFDQSAFPFTQTGLDPDGNPVVTPVGQHPVTGGLRSGEAAVRVDGLDGLLRNFNRDTGGVASAAPGIFSIAGILTDPEFQVVMRGLDRKKSIDLVTAPTVTVKSGQRAKIESGIEFIYPVEYDPPELPQSVGVAEGGFFPVTPAHPTTFETRELGFVLEVDPNIGPNNKSIDLNLSPQYSEFIGFVNYGSPITAAGTDAMGQPVRTLITENQILMPVFSSIGTTVSVNIYDGATLVIAGLSESKVDTITDKVPFVGDLPFVGRLFRSEVDRQRNRAVIIFLTAKIIDPTGARLNEERF